MKEMNKLKKDYDKIDIPSELEDVLKNSLRQAPVAQ